MCKLEINSGNLNPYIYTYNNPIRYIDPNGKQVESDATKGFIPNAPLKYTPLSPPSATPAPVAEPSPSSGFRGTLAAVGTRLLPLAAVLIPGTLNAPTYHPQTPFITTPTDGGDSDGITLYRGVSSDYRTATNREMYTNAKFGIAIPLGEEGGHDDPELHAKGNNNSIFTSWTTDKKVADKFARGLGGKYPGVILSKKFKLGEAFPNTSQAAQKANEGEWLVPGIVTGQMLKKLKNRNMKEYIKNKLLQLGLIDIDFYNDVLSIRIDEMDKDYLIELYQLRVKVNTEKNNQAGIEFSKQYLNKISQCNGDKLLSILLKTNTNNSKSFFSDKELNLFW